MKKGFARWLPRDEPIRPEPFGKIDYLCGLLVLFVSFGVYLLTLTPTVGFHDSGELITVAYTLGIAHPPGYPLYTLLGNLFVTLIPIGNIAYRMNMESALFASIAVMMTYFITLKLTTQTIPSIVASLILAFSATFWEQAVIAEKYTLNAFFFTLLIFILLKWQEAYSLKLKAYSYLYLFSFLLGLSFCHHFQTIYLVPGSVFFILATLWNTRGTEAQRKKKSPQILKTKFTFYILHFTVYILLFLLPLTLWCYLPLRASQEPVINWGDPSNLDNLIIHLTGQTYGVYFSKLEASLYNLPLHLKFFWSQFGRYFLWIGLIAIPIFLWRRLTVFLLFTLIFIANAIHSIRYTIVNIQDYYIPSFILVAILIGFGLSFISQLTPKLLKPTSIFFLILPLIPYHTNYFQNNRTKFYFAYDYGMNILMPLKEDAIIFSYGDYDIFPLYYLLYVEGRRKDISALCWTFLTCDWHIEPIKRLHPAISFPFEKIAIKNLRYHNLSEVRKDRLKRIILANIGRFSIYIGPGVDRGNYLLIPDGVFFRLLSKNIDRDRIKEELMNSEPIFSLRRVKEAGFKDMVASKIISNYAATYCERGNLYGSLNLNEKAIIEYKKALNLNIDCLWADLQFNLALTYTILKDYINAENEFKKLLKKKPDYKPNIIHYHLGLIYQDKGMINEAIREYKMVLKIDPNNAIAKQMLEAIKNSH